jgi:hypothetical protein
VLVTQERQRADARDQRRHDYEAEHGQMAASAPA